MVVFQGKPKRSARGSRYKKSRGKRQFELGRAPALTTIAKKRVKNIRMMGNHTKIRLLSLDTANVVDPKTKKFTSTPIKSTSANAASRHFARRSILTKGSIIETDLGKAKITSRPGQDGVINAVLV